ncbi:hypothetical protein K435DRAFT_652716 [Dendrothele bispora CBS 962.96]|uniref:MARVEL domain-containing protein n=1 Tax=Dendrothele bispora (strain CBS 962.96) TaxID=1314807 RepID=A0A4S8MJA9_DENBC|nr:hypothetical protein K435DRAFT_652716 [Dendrothele bispora CBS 962.96]
MSGGISNSGHAIVEDDMIISKPAIVFHASQIFFNFLAMACFASVAAFQAKWDVGPSGLSGFTLFITITGMLLSAFMLTIPVLYEKYDKFIRLARALKEVRVGFILTGLGTGASLLIAFIVTISAWTEKGCKNPDDDPNADKGDDFKNGLSGWCNTKKAAAIFLWLAFVFWGASVVLLIINWRQGKLLTGPRDPPFQRPMELEDGEDDEDDHHYNPTVTSSTPPAAVSSNPFEDSNRYSSATSGTSSYPGGYTPASTGANSTPYSPTSRPSMDAYGAFSDPAPTGYGAGGRGTSPQRVSAAPPMIPEPDLGPGVSRTMQYADPYAAVRATLQNQYGGPPSYESYPGYR